MGGREREGRLRYKPGERKAGYSNLNLSPNPQHLTLARSLWIPTHYPYFSTYGLIA